MVASQLPLLQGITETYKYCQYGQFIICDVKNCLVKWASMQNATMEIGYEEMNLHLNGHVIGQSYAPLVT